MRYINPRYLLTYLLRLCVSVTKLDQRTNVVLAIYVDRGLTHPFLLST